MRKFIVLVLYVLAACSSVKIKDVSKANDFAISSYKTFNFYTITNEGETNGPNYEKNLKLLKEAIVNEMGAKGVMLSSDDPGLLVNIGIVITEKVQTRETSLSMPGDRIAYMGQRNYHWQSQEVEVGRYREGTIIIDLVDPSKNELVWQGKAVSVVPEKQKNVPETIAEAMKKLFAEI